jgi:carboxymethylenebutenolidase
MGEMVEFAANGGKASGYLARPEGGAGKGVIVIQEWWGLNDNIKGIADRFAAEGFTALAPDLYHGKATAEPDEAGKLMMAMNVDQADTDLRGTVNYLKDLTGAPVGTVGFCMGGALALFAACKNGAAVGACVDFYGGHPAVQYDWYNLKAPVLGIWAAQDDFVNPNIPRYKEALEAQGVKHEFVTEPGTHHGFFNDERADVYNEPGARDAWERTLAHFRANL